MKKRIISLLCAAIAATGLVTVATAENTPVYRPFNYQDFDSLKPVGEGSGTHTGLIGNVYMQGKTTAPLEAADAPEGKRPDTNLSLDSDAPDKAIAIVLGDKGNNSYFNVNFSNNELQGQMKFAFNFYVPSRTKGNYSLLTLDIRDGSQNYHNLFAVRGNNDEYRFFPSGNSNSPQAFGTIKLEKWYYLEILINADENTYDVYLDGELQGQGAFPLYPKDKEIVYNAFRFSTSNNSNGADLKNTSVLIDDIFFGRETDESLPVAEFLSTQNSRGEENTEATEVDTDMTAIKVKFSGEMAAQTFKNNVTLTRGARQTEVAFEGVYDAAANVYTATILEQVMPCMEYKLNFGKGIYSENFLPLESDQTVSVFTKTVPFAVVDGYFTKTAEDKTPLNAIPAGADSIYANVTAVVTDQLQAPQDITMLVFYYEKGEMKRAWVKGTVLESSGPEPSEELVQLEIPLDGITPDPDTELEISVWDTCANMLPLAKAAAIQGE